MSAALDLDALLAEADAAADPAVPLDRLAHGGALIRRLADALRAERARLAFMSQGYIVALSDILEALDTGEIPEGAKAILRELTDPALLDARAACALNDARAEAERLRGLLRRVAGDQERRKEGTWCIYCGAMRSEAYPHDDDCPELELAAVRGGAGTSAVKVDGERSDGS